MSFFPSFLPSSHISFLFCVLSIHSRGSDPQAVHLKHLQAFQWAHAQFVDEGWPEIAAPPTFYDLRAHGRYKETPSRRGQMRPEGFNETKELWRGMANRKLDDIQEGRGNRDGIHVYNLGQ